MNSFIEFLNRCGDQAVRFAWPMLWQSSLLIVALFVLDLALRRKVRAAVRYALWFLVLAKLVLSPSLALPTGPAWWVRTPPPPPRPEMTSLTISYGDTTTPDFQAPPQRLPIPPRPTLSFAAWALMMSAMVSAALLAWLLVRWHSIARKIVKACGPDEPAGRLAVARRSAGLAPAIRVKLMDDAMSPAVFGLFRPVILLPQSLAENLAPDQLRAVLLHEAIHLRRRDVWLNCAQALLQIVYWWHPLLWLANARIRRLREEAVDDAVMLALRDDAPIYAPTLLEVAKLAFHRPLASLGLVGILESHNALRQRIERLTDFRAPRKAGLTFASVLGILAFSAVALPMGQAPEKTNGPTTNLGTSPNKTIVTNAFDGAMTSDKLVHDGKVLYEMGKIDDAEIALKAALAFNQDNQAAVYYLQLVEEARRARAARDAQSDHPDGNRGRAYPNGAPLEIFRINQPIQETKLKKLLHDAGVKMPPTAIISLDNGILLACGTEGQLALIHQAVRKLNGVENQGMATAANTPDKNVHLSDAREVIYRKLNTIRLDSIDWQHGLPLNEVMHYLKEQSKLRDPRKEGINFLYDLGAGGLGGGAPVVINPNTGLQQPTAAGAENTVDPATINVRLTLKDVTLQDLLDAIIGMSDTPIKYSVEDYGVVFSAKPSGPEPPLLEMRVFKVDTRTFYTALRESSGMDTTNISPMAQHLFSRLGVNLDPATGRSIFFNYRLGLLFVKATTSEMDSVERIVQALNQVAPQVHVKASFIEVPEPDVEQVMKSGTAVGTNAIYAVEIIPTDKMKSLLRQMESDNATDLCEPEVVTVSGRHMQMRTGMYEGSEEGEDIYNDVIIKRTVPRTVPRTDTNYGVIMDIVP